MSQKLHDYRKSYQKGTLTEQQAAVNPIEQFALWFQEVAQAGGVDEVNAMTLSTVDAAGYPRGRVVLLKHFDARGFQFFTNYSSQKGRAIAANPKVSLSFFWPNLERQVHIRGSAEKLTKEEYREFESWIREHGKELYENKIAYEVRWSGDTYNVRLCDENSYTLDDIMLDIQDNLGYNTPN